MPYIRYTDAEEALNSTDSFELEDTVSYPENGSNWNITFQEDITGVRAHLSHDGEPFISLAGRTVAIAASRVIQFSQN